MILALPVGAIFGPFVVHSGPKWVSQATASLSSATAKSAPTNPAACPQTSVEELGEIQWEGADVDQLWEVLRFDLTPHSLAQRWPRVGTSLADLSAQGFRVPLVTGTRPDDLAGSLTYYFNHQHLLQRIAFSGTTGDYRRLLRLLTDYYGFVNRPTNTPNVIVFEVPAKGAATSYLWIEPADVVRADQPLNRFKITLVLERPH